MKNIKLNLHIETSDTKFFQCIYGDEKRYEQIFINFVSNALKFTKPGGNVDIFIEPVKIEEANKNF